MSFIQNNAKDTISSKPIPIVSEEEYFSSISANKVHFDNLEIIVSQFDGIMEGNCFYENMSMKRRKELTPKQRNLFSIANVGSKILEIGFNAGHSVLLFLIGNPDCKVTCFDLGAHAYTEPCFRYLDQSFPGRISLIKGDSRDTLPKHYQNNPNVKFDILHIDGGHYQDIPNSDFINCRKLAREGSIIIWDDVDIPRLKKLWNKFISKNIIQSFEMLPTPMYAHAFGNLINIEPESSTNHQQEEKKRIAILVIAAIHHPLYVHYIRNYWSNLIAHTNANVDHIDVFLLFESSTDLSEYHYLWDNIILDPNSNYDVLCERRFQGRQIPGILSKTVHALELLHDKYDVFFRTNLSSIIRLSAFDEFVQKKDRIYYSGSMVWDDLLRKDLTVRNRIGPDKSIQSLEELDDYPGNTFFSGCGYFLSSLEASHLVNQKSAIRYDIIDDVSIGLMFSEHEILHRFTMVLVPETPTDEMITKIQGTSSPHIRLQHLPVKTAEEFCSKFIGTDLWK